MINNKVDIVITSTLSEIYSSFHVFNIDTY